MTGAISGSGNVAKSGPATLTLANAANTYSGDTTVSGGALLVTGSILTSETTVNGGGTVGGIGTLADLTVNSGAALAPGLSTGLLHTGDLALTAAASYRVELDTSAAGGFDQTDVAGAVDLDGTTLTLLGSLVVDPSLLESFTIIDNNDDDAVTGTFDGLPEGSQISFGGGTLYITYQGGDGNDVVLTTNVAPTADTGGPYPVDEGASVMLDGSASLDPNQSSGTLIYEWDFDLDGQFDDAFGPNPTFDASNLDGLATVPVRLRVTDNAGLTGIDSTSITISNVAPSNVSLNSGTINENDNFTLSGSFDDPGTQDTHTVVITWGPGEGITTLTRAVGVLTFNATHQYLDDNPSGTSFDVYPMDVTVTDDDGDSGTSSTSVAVNNVAPRNITLNSGSINETDNFTLNGSFLDPGTQDTHTVVITWAAGEGNTTLSLAAGVVTFSATHQYLDDNPSGTASDAYPISVTVTDDDGGSASATTQVTVNNLPPTATANAYFATQAIAKTGNVITDNTGSGADSDPASANDALTVYAVNGFSSSVGLTIPTSNGTVLVNPDGSFTYTPDTTFAGTDIFTYTITDGDLGYATAIVTIVVSPAAPGSMLTLPDSCLGGTALLITGTPASDTIVVEPGSSASTLQVTFNGVSTTVARPSGRIIVTGGTGDDNIQIAGAIANPVWLYGDAGDDRLNAGNGGSLLIGGNGNDQLLGGSGRDVMIGGEGADHLVGNSDDDILVAGFTVQDSRSSLGHDDFWCHVLDEWNSGDSFASRVQNLHPVLMSVVHDDDFIDAVDFLNGSAGNDWLIFRNGEDKVAGQAEATN